MFRRILVPIDSSPTSNRGLDEAIGLASDQKAKICLLHVVDELVVTGAADGMMYMPPSHIDEFTRATSRRSVFRDRIYAGFGAMTMWSTSASASSQSSRS
jgi:nucleotide-binding universal stress UspA family protein